MMMMKGGIKRQCLSPFGASLPTFTFPDSFRLHKPIVELFMGFFKKPMKKRNIKK
jgi:hypothetical protein